MKSTFVSMAGIIAQRDRRRNRRIAQWPGLTILARIEPTQTSGERGKTKQARDTDEIVHGVAHRRILIRVQLFQSFGKRLDSMHRRYALRGERYISKARP